MTELEYEACTVNVVLSSHVLDDCVYAIPRTLLLRLAGVTVTDNYHFTLRVSTHLSSQGSQLRLYCRTDASRVSVKSYRTSAYVTASRKLHSTVTAIFRTRALTNTISINWLTFCRSDQLLIAEVRNTVTICIQRTTVAVNCSVSRSTRTFVELVSDTIVISIWQNWFWQQHVARVVQLAVSEIQRVHPVQRLNSLLRVTQVEVQAQREVVNQVVVLCLNRRTQDLLCPTLTIQQVFVVWHRDTIFQGEVNPLAQAELNTSTYAWSEYQRFVGEDRSTTAITLVFSFCFVSIIHLILHCSADVVTVFVDTWCSTNDSVEIISSTRCVQGVHTGIVRQGADTDETVDRHTSTGFVETDIVRRSDHIQVQLVRLHTVVVVYFLRRCALCVTCCVVVSVPRWVSTVVVRFLPLHAFRYAVVILQTGRHYITP